MKRNIKDFKDECIGKMESYEEFIVDYYGYMDNIDDIIHEIADNNVDIYNYDLLEWAKDNDYYISRYVEEFGIDAQNFDFYGIIRGGQYLYIQETLYNNKSNMLEYLAYVIITEKEIEEIEEEKATEISLINYSEIDEIWELEDQINEILGIEEE